MIRFRELKVRHKLVVTFGAAVLPLLIAGFLSERYLRRATRETAEVELANVVDYLYRICETLQRNEGAAGVAEIHPSPRDVAFVRSVMHPMKVGQTGYAYCMDSSGTLVVHPAKEGQNIGDSRDSSGFLFIRELCRRAKALRPGEVGTYRYPWRNEEVGETRGRMKIVRFRYFKPWDWVIAAGSYEDEVYRAVSRMRLYAAPLVIASLLLVVTLTVAMNRIITRPLVRLAEAAAAMSSGRLTSAVELGATQDEFAVLGAAFNFMAGQIRDKTREMEGLIDARTQALAESRERYKSLVQSSVDGILTTDSRGVVTFVNHGFEAILGYGWDEVVGKRIWLFYPEGRARAHDIMRLLREKGSFANYEMEMIGRGRTVPIRTSASILRDSWGREQGTLGIFSDLTAEKKLQSDLKRTQAQLAQTMKLRALGDLVAGVAHEVNNPLMASITMTHLMKETDCPAGCPNRARIDIVGRCNERIAKIVDHLKKFSRQTHLEKVRVDVNAVVESALSLVGQQLLSREIQVIKELQEGLPEVLGESNELEQVFLNLIGNARDALEEVSGERILKIRSFISRLGDSGAISVEVCDNGSGIPEEVRDKLFEPFFTTKEVGKGTGLGLSISYGIVEEHGGRVDATNQAGGGACFCVTLPVAPSSTA